jgi:predicted amidohydrolase
VVAAAQSSSVAADIVMNVTNHLRFARFAADQGVELLIFPELSLTGYELAIARSHVLSPESPELLPLRHLASESRMTIVAGAPLLDGAAPDRLHIGALVLRPDGTVSTYTKQHVHTSEEPVFTSGSGGPLIDVEGTPVALSICFDATHASHALSAAGRGARVYAVCVMIDDVGYARKTALLESHAREHRMLVVMANYSGVTGGEASAGRSTFWSEDGRVITAAAGTDEALVVARRSSPGSWHGGVLALPA